MLFTLQNEYLKVTAKATGAELTSIFSKVRNKELLWNADAKFWSRHAPVLFPIVGKLKNNKYTVSDHQYSLPQHGFARDMDFEMYHQTTDKITFKLQSNPDTLQKYPYHFEFFLSYELYNNEVKTTYEVKNKGSENMFFSIGAHPAFVCPLFENETLEDYYLEFEKAEVLKRHLLTDGLFDGTTEAVFLDENILPLHEDLFDKDAVVFKNIQSQSMVLKSKKSDYTLQFNFEGFPHFGIWSKRGSGFLCLEPWCGYSDAIDFKGEFYEKEAIESVMPNQEFTRSFTAVFK